MPLVAISVIGTKVRPMPIEASMIPGRRSVTYVPSGCETHEEQQPGDRQRHADQRHLTGAEPRHEALRQARADDDPRGERQERETGLERGVAEHALQIERVEVEHREQPGGDEEHDDVRGAHRRHAEDARGGRAARAERRSMTTKATSSAIATAKKPPRVQRDPALLLRLHDPVHEREQSGGHGHGAGDVEALVRALVLRLGDDPHRQR